MEAVKLGVPFAEARFTAKVGRIGAAVLMLLTMFSLAVAAPMNASVTAYYGLHSGIDYARNATLTNYTRFTYAGTNCKIGGCAANQGTGYAQASAALRTVMNNTWSVVFWINGSTQNTDQTIYASDYAGGYYEAGGLSMAAGGNNLSFWDYARTNPPNSTSIGDAELFNSAWHFVAFTLNGTTGASTADNWAKIYLDGTKRKIQAVETKQKGALFLAALRVGNRYTSTATPLIGKIDEMIFFNTTLTAAQISYLYNSGAGRTYSDFISAPAAGAPANVTRIIYPLNSTYLRQGLFYNVSANKNGRIQVYLNRTLLYDNASYTANTSIARSFSGLAAEKMHNLTVVYNASSKSQNSTFFRTGPHKVYVYAKDSKTGSYLAQGFATILNGSINTSRTPSSLHEDSWSASIGSYAINTRTGSPALDASAARGAYAYKFDTSAQGQLHTGISANQSFSVAFWFKAAGTAGATDVLYNVSGNNGVFYTASDSIRIRVASATALNYGVTDGTYAHIVLTYNNVTDSVRSYINGVLRNSTTIGTHPAYASMLLGSAANPQDVYIDQLAIYRDVVLTAEDAANIYARQAWPFVYIRPEYTTTPLSIRTYTSTGYNFTWDSLTMNTSGLARTYNLTAEMNPAGVTIKPRMESSPYTPLTVNVSFTNSSTTLNYYNKAYDTYFPPANLTLGDTTVTVSRKGYIQRNYYLTITSSSEYTINAWLLNDLEGIYYTIVVSNIATAQPIEDAEITIKLTLNSSLQTVSEARTDTTGKAFFYLNPYAVYYLVVEADGYVSSTSNMIPDPTLKITYVNLYSTGTSGADVLNFTTVYDNVSYQVRPGDSSQNASFLIEFELSSSVNDIEAQGLAIYFVNATTGAYYLVNNETIDDQPSGTTIDYAVAAYGHYIARPTFKRADYDSYALPYYHFYLYNYTRLGSKKGQVTTELFGSLTYWMVTAVLTLLAVIFGFRFSPMGAGLMGLLVMAFMIYLNPVALMGVPAWGIWITTFLGFLGLTVLSRRF